jgi:hypothetical protein
MILQRFDVFTRAVERRTESFQRAGRKYFPEGDVKLFKENIHQGFIKVPHTAAI